MCSATKLTRWQENIDHLKGRKKRSDWHTNALREEIGDNFLHFLLFFAEETRRIVASYSLELVHVNLKHHSHRFWRKNEMDSFKSRHHFPKLQKLPDKRVII